MAKGKRPANFDKGIEVPNEKTMNHNVRDLFKWLWTAAYPQVPLAISEALECPVRSIPHQHCFIAPFPTKVTMNCYLREFCAAVAGKRLSIAVSPRPALLPAFAALPCSERRAVLMYH